MTPLWVPFYFELMFYKWFTAHYIFISRYNDGLLFISICQQHEDIMYVITTEFYNIIVHYTPASAYGHQQKEIYLLKKIILST